MAAENRLFVPECVNYYDRYMPKVMKWQNADQTLFVECPRIEDFSFFPWILRINHPI